MIHRNRNLIASIQRMIWTRKAYRFFIRQWVEIGDAKAATQVVNTLRSFQQITPLELEMPRARRLLVVAPHPDDEIIGPGGTIMKAIASGAQVQVLYLTSGTPAEQATREAEAVRVSRRVGFSCHFQRWGAGGIPVDRSATAAFAEVISEFRPDVLLIPFLLDDHDDHRRASELLLETCRRGQLRLVPEVWAYQVYSAVLANVVVDVTGLKTAKEDAIRLYASQMQSRDWANFASGLSAWTSRLLPGRREAAYAEAFFVLPLKEYLAVSEVYFGHGADQNYSRHYRDPI